MSVYVVVASDGEKVKDCVIYWRRATAFAEYRRLREIWGGASVCILSRRICFRGVPTGTTAGAAHRLLDVLWWRRRA